MLQKLRKQGIKFWHVLSFVYMHAIASLYVLLIIVAKSHLLIN